MDKAKSWLQDSWIKFNTSGFYYYIESFMLYNSANLTLFFLCDL